MAPAQACPPLHCIRPSIDNNVTHESSVIHSIDKGAKPHIPVPEIIVISDDKPDRPRSPVPSVVLIEEVFSPSTPEQTSEADLGSPSLKSPPRSTESIVQDLSAVIKKEYSQDEGQTYILSDPEGNSPFYKIGKSNAASNRLAQHKRNCGLKNWNLQIKPSSKIKQSLRLERLAQTELKNFNCAPQCVCRVQHSEYYLGDPKDGLDALQGWSHWLVQHKPYGDDDQLASFWDDRLDKFLTDIPRYFKCGGDDCHKPDKGPACQGCVRSGWRLWTQPTPQDFLEYACQVNIPFRWLRKTLQASSEGKEDTVLPYVELVGCAMRLASPVFGLMPFLYMSLVRLTMSVFFPDWVKVLPTRLADTILLSIAWNLIIQQQTLESPGARPQGSTGSKRAPSRLNPQRSLTPRKTPVVAVQSPTGSKAGSSPRNGSVNTELLDDPFASNFGQSNITVAKRISSAPRALSTRSISLSPSNQAQKYSRKRRKSDSDQPSHLY
ncbi:hypothetical protein BJX99DRAFT_77103 [Aspergillus californicus]